jgi:ATP-dependent exoDNAse (exonuclease V) alpha subunit
MRQIFDLASRLGYKHIVLSGDGDQLGPVGQGQPFIDLVERRAIPVARLTKIMRTAEGGGIARLCAAIRDGEPSSRAMTLSILSTVGATLLSRRPQSRAISSSSSKMIMFSRNLGLLFRIMTKGSLFLSMQ